MSTLAGNATGMLAEPPRVRMATMLSDCVVLFTLTGMVGAWLAAVVFAEGVGATIDAAGRAVMSQDKSMVYYLLHGGALVSVLVAGGLGAINGGYARLDRVGRLALWTLIFASILWTLVAYEWNEILSPAVLGATGPFVWFSTLLLFAGMEPEVWPRLRRLIDALIVATAILAVRSLVRADSHSDAGVYTANQYFCLLFWYGGWRCLAREYGSRAWIVVDASVLALLTVLALWLQRRSWIIDTGLLVGLYMMSVSKRTEKTGQSRSANLLATTAIVVPIVVVLLVALPTAREALAGLLDRLGEDTRSEQYRLFFAQIRPEDLILGLGPKASYYYGPSNPEYQYFDNGYLWMAFIGGLPILVSYCLLVVRPGLAVFFRRAEKDSAVAASGSLLLIWMFVLGGVGVFSCPSLTAYSYFICLTAGLCYGPHGGVPDNRINADQWEGKAI